MAATTFANPSFELVAGTAPVVVSGAEPFTLADELVLSVVTSGVVQPVVFEVGTRAAIVTTAEPFALVHGQTLDVAIDGAPAATITFLLGDFADITQATAIEVAAKFLTVVGSFVTINSGIVTYGSVTKGSSSTIAITGGTAAAAFGWPDSDTGVQYFVDIALATAIEVEARMTAQLVDVTVTTGGGVVTVTGDSHGSSSCVQVLPSVAQSALQFPLDQSCGVSREGFARGWAVSEVSTRWDFAEYHTNPGTLLFPGGVERFELGWAGNEADEFSLGVVADAIFDGVEDHEGFEMWGALISVLPATTAAVFDATLVPGTVEDFSDGWPSIPGNEGSSFTIPALTFAEFVGPVSLENFEAGWPSSPGNEGDLTTIGPLTTAQFGTSLAAVETFDSSTTTAVHYRVLNVAEDDIMSILLDGLAFTLVAPVAPTVDSAATALAAQVQSGVLRVSAVAATDNVYVTQETPGDPLVFGSSGQPPGQLVVILGEDVDPSDDWPGLYRNPAL